MCVFMFQYRLYKYFLTDPLPSLHQLVQLRVNVSATVVLATSYISNISYHLSCLLLYWRIHWMLFVVTSWLHYHQIRRFT